MATKKATPKPKTKRGRKQDRSRISDQPHELKRVAKKKGKSVSTVKAVKKSLKTVTRKKIETELDKLHSTDGKDL